MRENKSNNPSALPLKIKVDELTIKKFLGQPPSGSLRPMPSLKRKKSLMPKAMIQTVRRFN